MFAFLAVCNSKKKRTWLRSSVHLRGFAGFLGGGLFVFFLNPAAQC